MASHPDKAETKEMSSNGDPLYVSDSDEDLPDIECDICLKKFSNVYTYEQHLNSKKHFQKLTKGKLMHKLGKGALKKDVTNKGDDDLQNSDSEETFYCDVCDLRITGCISYMAHTKGGIHAKKLKQKKLKEKILGFKDFVEDQHPGSEEDEDGICQKPFAHCETCQKSFNGPEAYQQHMHGINHKKKLRHVKLVGSLKKDDNPENKNEDDELFSKCEVCNKSFSGPVPYKIHLKSQVHEKEMKRVELEKELKDLFLKDPTSAHLICKECKKTFPDSNSFKSHMDNNSHGKQKVKDEMFGFVASNPEIVAVKSVQNISSDEENEEKESFQNGHYFLVCKLCHMSFSGPESARDHLKSKNHLKAKREKAERKILKEKIKAKQNGGPLTGRNSFDLSSSDGQSKRSTDKGDKNVSAANKESVDITQTDDFEIIG